MSNELEDFLRRAAQRRAETAAARAEKAPQPPRRPQYSDRSRERTPTVDDVDDEIVVADLVQSVPSDDLRDRQRSRETQGSGNLGSGNLGSGNLGSGNLGSGNLGSLTAGSGGLGSLQAGSSGSLQASSGQGEGMLGAVHRAADDSVAAVTTAAVHQTLLRMMTEPNGVNQAILAREILERPTHRWE